MMSYTNLNNCELVNKILCTQYIPHYDICAFCTVYCTVYLADGNMRQNTRPKRKKSIYNMNT